MPRTGIGFRAGSVGEVRGMELSLKALPCLFRAFTAGDMEATEYGSEGGASAASACGLVRDAHRVVMRAVKGQMDLGTREQAKVRHSTDDM
jgi:hypothetical protein